MKLCCQAYIGRIVMRLVKVDRLRQGLGLFFKPMRRQQEQHTHINCI